MSVSSVIVTTIFFLLGILSLLASLANWIGFLQVKTALYLVVGGEGKELECFMGY